MFINRRQAWPSSGHYDTDRIHMCIPTKNLIMAFMIAQLGGETGRRFIKAFMKVSWLWLEILLDLWGRYTNRDIPYEV